ncbi:MAG TPA: Xaa-Pro peptidase family protein [Candidatus Limnocylindria bacterium]|nr:Xaa-Pro peptidase family protein [Candidatus Limnocylindria bacterium]
MTLTPTTADRVPAKVLRARLSSAAAEAADRGLDALLVTPSSDYAYLLGYRPPELERLTCLVVPAVGVPAAGVPQLVVPRLEAPLARHQLGELAENVEVLEWDETDDPFHLVQRLVPPGAARVGVQDQMWARFVLRLRAVLDPVELVVAGPAIAAMRRVKGPDELERLRAAAAAADQAMLAITSERFAGRTEADISRRIRDLLLEAGHDTADFAIVASGPNAASPHHEPGSRVIGDGDAVVLDIGGTLGAYWSDTTRTAFVGEPPPDFVAMYEVLRAAQEAACAAVRPGVAFEEVDRAARDVIGEAGYGERFIHRTGHGIGLELHEEPYVVAGNRDALVPGNAFSVEPGIYLSGQWGARIEDIVVCTGDGGERLNLTDRRLYVVD